MCPSLRGLTCHRPSRRGISQNLPVAVGGFTRVWEGFSWVMVPGVGVVLNTGLHLLGILFNKILYILKEFVFSLF